MRLRDSMVLCPLILFFISGLPACATEKALSSQIHQKGETTILLDRNGTYKKGKWTYTYTVTHPGSRSQGAMGRLFYDGRPLSPPEQTGDYYETPLGRFYHAGMPEVPWGERGWMPAAHDEPTAEENPLPVPTASETAKERAVKEMVLLLKTMTADSAQSPYLKDPLEKDYLTDTDPWGTPYMIFQDLRGGEGEGQVARLELTSAGADQKFDTDDDIVRVSRFIRISDPADQTDIAPELLEPAGSPEPEKATIP